MNFSIIIIILVGFFMFYMAPISTLFIIGVLYLINYIIENQKNTTPDAYNFEHIQKYAPTIFLNSEKLKSLHEYIYNNGDVEDETFGTMIRYYISDQIDDFYNSNCYPDGCDKIIFFNDYAFDVTKGNTYMGRMKYYVDGTFKIVDVKNVKFGQDGLVKYPQDYVPNIFDKSQLKRDARKEVLKHKFDNKKSVYGNTYKFINKRKYNEIYEAVKKTGTKLGPNIAKCFDIFTASLGFNDVGIYNDVYMIKSSNGELYYGQIEVYPYFDKKKFRFVGIMVCDNT